MTYQVISEYSEFPDMNLLTAVKKLLENRVRGNDSDKRKNTS